MTGPRSTVGAAEQVATLDATAQADLVRPGEVTPLELVEWAIERVERLNPTLNAVVTPMFPSSSSTVGRPHVIAGQVGALGS